MRKLDNKFKHILPVILLLLLITIIIGVTYAVYTLTTIGNENSITTGLVSMSYTESTNVIDIKNALPMSDAEGKTQSNYFDFSVTSNLTLGENDPNIPVHYSIELEPLSIDTGYNALQDNQIKIYLENKTNNRVLINSKLISDISNYKLYNTSHIHKYNVNSITTNYRIRAWINYSVDASNWSSSNTYEYKFRINVNSNVNEVGYTTPEYCFTTDEDTITGYNCYEGNSYGYETITDVVMPEKINGVTITEIADGSVCVAECDSSAGITPVFNNLTSVTIPDSVTTIGDYAFYQNNLTSVTIPNSLTTIGTAAFSHNNLTSVTIPDSVTTIDDYAFSSNNLTSVTIPDGVTTIVGSVFSGNPNLTSIVVDSNNAVYDSRNNSNAIIETSTNTLIQGCKTTVIPNTVTTIGWYAFANNNLTSVIIPNSVTTIEGSAFYNNNLTSVTIPDSVTTIDDYAFANNNLTSVTIPDSVTTIKSSAFSSNNLTSVTIPNSLTTIVGSVFSNNPNLTSIVVDSNNAVYDSRNNSNAIIETSTNTLIQGCKTTVIPNTVTTIGDTAFGGMGLTEITIPNSVTAIGYSAFKNNNLQYVLINEDSNLTSIGFGAFSTTHYSHTLTIYNNSGKSFDWGYATQGRSGYSFVTGSIPSYTGYGITYGPVTVTTGTPS